MRPGPVLLLLPLLFSPVLQAEQNPSKPLAEATSAQAPIDELEQQSLDAEPQANDGERENVQLQRLRQENQRLKLQLKKAQAQAPQPLISEQQMWFAVGAGAGLLGVILGALLRRGRRSRGEWLN